MFQQQPHMRLTMADFVGNEWMKGEMATEEEVFAEMTKRRQAINYLNQKKDEEVLSKQTPSTASRSRSHSRSSNSFQSKLSSKDLVKT